MYGGWWAQTVGAQHARQVEQHWPFLNGVATICVRVPPIVLMRVGAPCYCLRPSACSNTGIWVAFVCIFICTQNCFCVWVYAYLLVRRRKSNLLKERRERWVVRSAGTSKPLRLADWLPGSPVDWKSPKGKQTSDLITNPIMWASYLQCEQCS